MNLYGLELEIQDIEDNMWGLVINRKGRLFQSRAFVSSSLRFLKIHFPRQEAEFLKWVGPFRCAFMRASIPEFL